MTNAFYIASLVAILSTALTIVSANAVHALLYFIVSLLAAAMILFTLGAPLAAALEVIIYAGAIVVLFIFVVMMLNLGRTQLERERSWLQPHVWIGPGLLAGVLLLELVAVLGAGGREATAHAVSPKEVGIAMFGPYLLAVELASMLLLAALVGAYHLGRRLDRRSDGDG